MNATALLNNEIQTAPNNGMLAAAGERYIDMAGARADVRGAIAAGYEAGKTLKEMIEKSKEHFQAQAVNGCAAIRNDEAEAFFDAYWGVAAVGITSRRREVSLEDFL